MAYVVDRRLNGKHKSAVNRQRFLKRYRKHIREAVGDAVSKRSITDIESGERIVIPRKDTSEPQFHHGPGGRRTVIHPGNKEFNRGDKIKRPEEGDGQGGGDASDQGEGQDEFAFDLNLDEFLNFLFEDLALPNLVKRHLKGAKQFKRRHGGIVSQGQPNKINIVRSMRQASMRRRALSAAKRHQLTLLEKEQRDLLAKDNGGENSSRLKEIDIEIDKIKSRINHIPFIDTVDLRFNHNVKEPIPISRAVMFCIMDVSGSMTQEMKDLAKRFFLLLHLFLKRNYEETEIVFIRHHTAAKEVSEEEFFYSRETGGTVVSSALKLCDHIIKERYPEDEWNIYGAQASDGDNWNDDSPLCAKILQNSLLHTMQYFSYIEIMPRRHQALWHEYEKLHELKPDVFSLKQIDGPGDIFPVFRQLFKKRMEESA